MPPSRTRLNHNTGDKIPTLFEQPVSVPHYLISSKGCETGPMVYSPYLRRLESLTVAVIVATQQLLPTAKFCQLLQLLLVISQRLGRSADDLDPRLSLLCQVGDHSPLQNLREDARYASQDPFIQSCPIQSRHQSVLAVRSCVERNEFT